MNNQIRRLLLRAEVTDGDSRLISHTLELGAGWARIQHDHPPRVGTSVGIKLSFPSLLEPIEARARVIAHEAATAPGAFGAMRVELSFANDGDRKKLEHLFARCDAGGQKPAVLRGLVVDDSVIVREIFSYTFRKRVRGGLASTIDMASDAEQAAAMLAKNRYDFVVVDQVLPGKSGSELVQDLRAEPRHAGTVVIGISVAGAEARDALHSAGADVYLNKPIEILDLCTTLHGLANKTPEPIAGPRKKVLVIDDSPMMLELAKEALQQAGFEAFVTSNLAEMEVIREREQPDLILLDVQMPEAYGDDVANVLRGLHKVTVPVLLFSILDEQELAARAQAAEVDGYVFKGAGLDEMVRRVKALIGDAE